MPQYYFLTGSTGLLGSYLLRDCLRRGFQIAVLVRRSRLESASGRIETILARWEQTLGCVLPRPVVFEGDICQVNLGLDETDSQWVRQNCHSIVHSAASLSFTLDEKTNEPWRSNLDGTRNVVEFARSVGIRQFHHVSTAYVCGLRSGRILESELDVGQSLGNPYEESKLRSEQLVRQAGFEQLTVHRPAIIVGDSQTGYTTTYHGFYTPLNVICAMFDKVPATDISIIYLLQALGLSGTERKNFVPVEWVSATMTEILSDQRLHGETYHLAPRKPSSLREMAESLSSAFQRLIVQTRPPRPAAVDSDPRSVGLDELFRSQMQMYQAYWRDDPEFDTANTQRAVPHLPCPDVDSDVMGRLATYAIENNFGWPVPPPLVPPFDVGDQLRSTVKSRADGNATAGIEQNRVALDVAGPGGGQWTLTIEGQNVIEIADGVIDRTIPVVYMTSGTFARLASQELTAEQALRIGGLVLSPAQLAPPTVLGAVDVATGTVPPLSSTQAPNRGILAVGP